MRRFALVLAGLAGAAGIAVLGEATGAEGDPSCPAPHAPPLASWTAPGDARPPPIDQRAPAHLRTATFALG